MEHADGPAAPAAQLEGGPLERPASRGEVWSAEVPDGVGVLTVGADVQDDRVELEVVGWGWDEESWSIDDHVIEGDPDSLARLGRGR